MKRAVLYLRVSKQDQTIENQRSELERVANARGWRVVGTFKDEGISGAFGREVRDVSRLSRSLGELVSTLDELHACGIDLYLHQQAVDTTTPAGKAMFQMCGVFAEFERGMLSERVKAGLSRAREQGKLLGRPVKIANVKAIIEGRKEGKTIRAIANEQQLSVGKIHKVVQTFSE